VVGSPYQVRCSLITWVGHSCMDQRVCPCCRYDLGLSADLRGCVAGLARKHKNAMRSDQLQVTKFLPDSVGLARPACGRKANDVHGTPGHPPSSHSVGEYHQAPLPHARPHRLAPRVGTGEAEPRHIVVRRQFPFRKFTVERSRCAGCDVSAPGRGRRTVTGWVLPEFLPQVGVAASGDAADPRRGTGAHGYLIRDRFAVTSVVGLAHTARSVRG
jgi:hypothetical protein